MSAQTQPEPDFLAELESALAQLNRLKKRAEGLHGSCLLSVYVCSAAAYVHAAISIEQEQRKAGTQPANTEA